MLLAPIFVRPLRNIPDHSNLRTFEMASELEFRILDVLRKATTPMLAREIAVALQGDGLASVNRRKINQVLYNDLKGRVRKDEEHRWSLGTPVQADSERGAHKNDQQRTAAPSDDYTLTLNDAYAVLGVTDTATFEEIKRAYRIKIAEWHPDKVNTMAKELRELATRTTARINDAYEMIKNSQKASR